jgi:CRISPR-associated endonuclease/helicase Cas3
MTPITIDHFNAFFNELHNCAPYPWQRRLVEKVICGDWPGAIDLPTGSGKTACLDVAVFALAAQASRQVAERNAPRRIFFCVNRRVIVDEAYRRARRIAETLWKVEQDEDAERKPVLRRVARALRELSGTASDHTVPPLDALELRGGIYRDNRWARSITHATIVCSTLDQLGSRLLFRGYGVSTNAAPIQAALIAYDSLILLDEAHISEPFRQTLDSVTQYLDPQEWAEQAMKVRPVTVVPMTATPNEAMRQRGIMELEADDRAVPSLVKRLKASKLAQLQPVNDMTKGASEVAMELAKNSPRAVGIMVNRVATARAIYQKLCEWRTQGKTDPDATIELVIGSMRPLDREEQTKRLAPLVGPDRPNPASTQTSFVVATQCLEVGADYDFDVLITECASLDALRQRFGRLNRAGREIEARAFILASQKEIKPVAKLDDANPLDPIYGNALARTWNWLQTHAIDGKIDFGIDALDALIQDHGEHRRPPADLLAPSASLDAPVLLPAHLDLWCQNSPKPVPEPDISLFIHGPQRSEPDVQVCWRADLVEDDSLNRDHWCDVVALLPPTSAECVSAPISRVRRWLTGQDTKSEDHGDALSGSNGDSDVDGKIMHHGVLWRGVRESHLLQSPEDLRPGDTLVLSAADTGSRSLGHLPPYTQASGAMEQEAPIADIAEIACARARAETVLRLHPAVRSLLPEGPAIDKLINAAANDKRPATRSEWSAILNTAADAVPDAGILSQVLQNLARNSLRIAPYPDGRGVILTSRRRLSRQVGWAMEPMDDGDDQTSRIRRERPVTMSEHVEHVAKSLDDSLQVLPLEAFHDILVQVAQFHDLGKADERFQAVLRQTDRTDAWLLTNATVALLAKSAGYPQTRAQLLEACRRADLPEGFRHEMLSVQLAERAADRPGDKAAWALFLHLIAAHHGRARPFAPVVFDDGPPAVDANVLTVTQEQRASLTPPHRLDSGIPERFWQLTRRHGWWGLAYLEALFRLADQKASAAEDEGLIESNTIPEPQEALT